MRTLFPLFEINQVSANDRTRRTQERRWKARRQSQQAPPDTWPARDKRPAAMAAGADESPRGTAAPAHGLRRGSAALLSHPQGITPQAPAVGLFCWLALGLHSGKLPTDCLQATEKKKPHYQIDSGVSFVYLGWLMGLEPTTTGITILDSTN